MLIVSLRFLILELNEYSCLAGLRMASALAFDGALIMREISTTAFNSSRCSQGVDSVNVCFENCGGKKCRAKLMIQIRKEKVDRRLQTGVSIINVWFHKFNLQMNERLHRRC